MIPQKIKAFFEFIDFLDQNKNNYIEKYIPLCEKLKELDMQRNLLKPNNNYKDKESYDIIQKEISEKMVPIKENIYKPITNKLKELGIWAGDVNYTSVWNNNISEISHFKRTFIKDDIKEIFKYKQKYLNFRTETNSNFLCLSFIFSDLDQLLKELFDFFKDTNENEFKSFEAKTIEVKSITEIAQDYKEKIGKNVKFSIPAESIFCAKQNAELTKFTDIKNQYNVFNIGDKIEIVKNTKNKGNINLGNNNKISGCDNDEIAKQSFDWQKGETIIMIIIGILGLLIAFL